MRLVRLNNSARKAARRFAPRRCVECEILDAIAAGQTKRLEDASHLSVALPGDEGTLTAFIEELSPGLFVCFLIRRDRVREVEVAA